MKSTTSKWLVSTSTVFILASVLFHVWNVRASQTLPKPIVGFSVNPTHPHYATIRENGLLKVTDYQTSTVIASYLIPLPFQDINNLDPSGFNIQDIPYSLDGSFIAVSIAEISSGGLIYLVEWQTGLMEQAYDQIDLHRVVDMSWSPDGNRLVIASLDGGADQIVFSDIAIVNIDASELEQNLANMGSIDGQAWSVVSWSVGNIIAYANDTTLVFWDASANALVESVMTSSRVKDAIWSSNGQYLAMLHTDRTLQIWDVSSSLLAPQQTITVLNSDFLSLDMQWLADNLLAINVWS